MFPWNCFLDMDILVFLLLKHVYVNRLEAFEARLLHNSTNTGFHIRFENRLPCRATTIKLRLPDKAFWLPDNINVKTNSKTFGCPDEQPGVNVWLPDKKK